jgi:hypothetical protein
MIARSRRSDRRASSLPLERYEPFDPTLAGSRIAEQEARGWSRIHPERVMPVARTPGILCLLVNRDSDVVAARWQQGQRVFATTAAGLCATRTRSGLGCSVVADARGKRRRKCATRPDGPSRSGARPRAEGPGQACHARSACSGQVNHPGDPGRDRFKSARLSGMLAPNVGSARVPNRRCRRGDLRSGGKDGALWGQRHSVSAIIGRCGSVS